MEELNNKIDDFRQIRIIRPFYEHKQLREDFSYQKPNKPNATKKWKKNFRLKKIIINIIPVFNWISTYNWKNDLIKDTISGITVAIMHIPQGMAYAILGNVPAVVGIYMAFFPVLIYFIFGTSRHNSMGSFSIGCLMVGKSVLEHSDPSYFHSSGLKNYPNISSINNNNIEPTGYSPIQVATSVTFIVALFQLGMYVLRLGVLSALLSETLISGFTTGAAVQVLISQLADLFGLVRVPKFKGNFASIRTLINVVQSLAHTNFAALIISSVTITISAINNDYFKPVVAKISPFPFPMELVAVVVGTLITRYCNLQENYSIQTVGDIPLGLPIPTLPIFELLPNLLIDGISIAIVTYTISLSMALIFAQKLNYEVDANQELLAVGLSNIFGSFFSCLPLSASLSRSLIQQTVGGVTQIASLISCLILLIILLWIGPFFEALPRAVLAGVIVVALKGMLLQILQFFKFWKLSKLDALVWMGTFLTVIFVGIDVGLICGVALSLISVLFLSVKPRTCLLGQIPNTDFYLDISRYKEAKELDGIKIFHYSGGINFATKSMFKTELIDLIEINPQKEVIYRTKLAKYLGKLEIQDEKSKTLTDKLEKIQHKVNTDMRCLILDFSTVSHIDPSGVSMLKSTIDSFTKLDIPVYIASCKEPVYEMLTKFDPDYMKKTGFRSFITIHDAVHYATELFNSSTNSTISTIQL